MKFQIFNEGDRSSVWFLTCLVSLLSVSLSGAPDIQGTVFDMETGEPLIGANIQILGTDFGSATNLNGVYVISGVPNGKLVLKASMIGYREGTKILHTVGDGTILVSFALKSIVLEVGQIIIVEAKRRIGEESYEHYSKLNLITTEDVISRVEGINLIRRGSYAQEPLFRGLSGGQVNITIDGMKSFSACTDRMDPVTSYIEIDALNIIEMSKGALSLEQGSTVGGTLNLTHRKPKLSEENKHNFTMSTEYQSVMRGKKYLFNYNLSKQRYGLILNTVYRKAHDYLDATHKTIPFTGYEKVNYNLGLITRINTGTIMYLDFIGDDAWDVGYASLPMDAGYAKMRMLGASLKFSELSQWLPVVETKAYYNTINHWMDDSQREDLLMNMQMDMPGWTQTGGAYLDAKITPSSDHLIKWRSEFYKNTSYAEMSMQRSGYSDMFLVSWPEIYRWNVGHYIEYQPALRNSASIKVSVRYDYFISGVRNEMGKRELGYDPDGPLERTDHLWSGNFIMDYSINRNWQSTIVYARGVRMPTVTEMYGYYVYNAMDGFLYIGNPEIKSEKSHQIEWRNLVTNDMINFNLNLYRYKFQDYIFGTVIDDSNSLFYVNGWKSYQNVDRTFIYGMEISVSMDLHKNMLLFGGLSYERGKIESLSDNFPLIPPFEGHMATRYSWNSFWVQLDGTWSTTQNKFSKLSGENPTPAYGVLAIRGQYVISEKFILNFGIENLLNEKYHDHLDWTDVPRPGRNLFIIIKMSVQ